LPGIQFYKEGVGLLLTDRTCNSRVEEDLKRNEAKNKVLAKVLISKIGFTNQTHSFIKDQLKFEKNVALNFHLHTFRLIQETFVEFGALLEKKYLEMMSRLIDSIMPRLNFSLPLEHQLRGAAEGVKKFIEAGREFDNVNATHFNFNLRRREKLIGLNVPATLIKTEWGACMKNRLFYLIIY
jgi:hypothetical protein